MSRSNLLIITAARALVEAVPLAVGASVAAMAFGRVPAPLPTWLDTAAALVLWSALGPLLAAPRARAIGAVATLVLSAAFAAAAVGRATDATSIALVAGALYGALVVWRGLAVAATASSWRAAAYAALAATLALAFGAVATGAAAAVALSVARGTEETFAGTRSGDTRRRPGTFSAALVGIGALIAAAALPEAGGVLGAIAEFLSPYLQLILIILVTPFVYLADAIIRAILPVFRQFDMPLLRLLPGTPVDDEETVRVFSFEARIFLERFVLALALSIIAAFVIRAILTRVVLARASAPLEREAIAGVGVGELLRGLFARRTPSRPARPGGDDPHARVRRAYWDLLALAERTGVGWRAPAQTPREHLATLPGDPWRAANGVVAPFEASRYAGRAEADDAERAERALREVEGALTARA